MVQSPISRIVFPLNLLQRATQEADTSTMKVMRYGLLVLMVVGSMGVPRGAFAQSFLTYEQFSQLDRTQQLNYIEAVRKLALSLARNPHLSGRLETESLFFQRIDLVSRSLPVAWAQAQAQAQAHWEVCRVSSARHYSTEDLISKMLLMQNCREAGLKGVPQRFVSHVPESVAVLAQEYSQRIYDGRLNPSSFRVKDASGGLEAVISEIRRAGVKDNGNYEASLSRAEVALQRARAQFGSKPAVASRSRVTTASRSKAEEASSRRKAAPSAPGVAANSSQKMTTNFQPKAAEKSSTTSTVASSQDRTTEESSNDEPSATATQVNGTTLGSNQCLYGGFVIDQRARKGCQPLSQLPEDLTTGFFEQDQFQCGGSTPVLCNPLLFGYLPNCDEGEKPPCFKKRPLCTFRSPRATADCYNQAQERNTLRHVEDVWKGPEGQKMYESFTASLEGLCDSESLEKRNLKPKSKMDIEQTCRVAFQAFDQLVEKKFLPQDLRKGSVPTTPSQPAASGAQQ